ncbi:MAG: hypothetical protein ACI9BF_000696 [Candidatus Paceibacteria bacterium]|jgi:hypothetical protein
MNIHLLLPTLVVILALAFLDPLHLLMPTMLVETILGLLTLVTILYGITIFKERAHDEREERIRALSHRISYLVGMNGLMAIIAYHFITMGSAYPETIILLVVLVMTKAVVHWYGEKHL